jgi:tetratricopeptide (TPR) repeat protein
MEKENCMKKDQIQSDSHPVLSEIADLIGRGAKLQRAKQLAEAESLYLQAVTLAANELGKDHLVYGYALSDMAQVQEERGDVIAARNNFTEALYVLEARLGNQDPEAISLFGRLHHLYR